MAWETEAIKGSDQQLRSVFCSNTGGNAMIYNRCVAYYQPAATAYTHDKGDGLGFGYVVDYPSATSSMVCGVLWNPNSWVSTVTHQRPAMAVRRGVVQCGVYETVTTTYHVLVPEVGASLRGLGDPTDVNGVMSADWGLGHFGICLQAGGAKTTTQTIRIWANCQI